MTIALPNVVSLVTGAAGGIGRELCKSLKAAGAQRGAPFNSTYCTTKAAVAMLSKCMGAEFAALGYNIRVNSVHPGGIHTPMLHGIIDRYIELGAMPDRETAFKGLDARHPIG